VTAPTDGDGATSERREPNHLLRAFLIWLVLAAFFTPFIWFVLGPDMAPGNMTTSASSIQWDLQVLLTIAAPIMLLVYVWFGYNLVVFRYRGDDPDANGLWIRRDSIKLQIGWILATTCVVLFLFGFGTYELVYTQGAGGGEGPSAIWGPKDVKEAAAWSPAKSSSELQVQVIGQQWAWTYRYPQFGGMETTVLNLPVDTWIKFNVTSLDVIHSFWAYNLGVKADANPDVNDVAFTKALHTGRFEVRCAELCGIWHGAMLSVGHVMPKSSFYSWARSNERTLAAATKELPPYALTYTPSYTGAGGGYYTGLTQNEGTH